MSPDPLFCALGSAEIAAFISEAKHSVCYAAPGIQIEPAKAMVLAAFKLGSERITICIDFDERVMRMGYGSIEAVNILRAAHISTRNSPGLRTAVIIVDNKGFSFTPTALYLESEPRNSDAPNAMRLTDEQVREVLSRLSPASKVIAIAQAQTAEECARIAELPVEVGSEEVSKTKFDQVDARLKEAPPVKFDIARQVRVFESYLQYVELKLTGAAIQRHRMAIPADIQKLGGMKDLEGRLRTTFDLIERDSKLSSKALEEELNELRKNFTPSLGGNHGRVVLKSQKALLEQKIKKFGEKLENHQKEVEDHLKTKLQESREQIIDYYLPLVMKFPPDAMMGRLFSAKPTVQDGRKWLDRELNCVFPDAKSLIEKMSFEVQFKDVTFETLNAPDFIEHVKKVFPDIDWDKAYSEFKAAREEKKGWKAIIHDYNFC